MATHSSAPIILVRQLKSVVTSSEISGLIDTLSSQNREAVISSGIYSIMIPDSIVPYEQPSSVTELSMGNLVDVVVLYTSNPEILSVWYKCATCSAENMFDSLVAVTSDDKCVDPTHSVDGSSSDRCHEPGCILEKGLPPADECIGCRSIVVFRAI